MSTKKIKSKIKEGLLVFAPKVYHKILVKRLKQDLNINNQEISSNISIPYSSQGKYPTMYKKPPKFYDKRKKKMTFDPEGIPQLLIDDKLHYHPVYMIQHALSEYGFYLSTHEEHHFDNVRKISEWLVENQDPENGCWYYTFDYYHQFTNFMLKAPWMSSMAQGQAISLLTRIYHITKDQKYLESAIKATKVLDKPIPVGGLASDFLGKVVYEEFPTKPYSYTLNGFMFCILGLYDLSQYTKNKEVKKLLDTALETLVFMLPMYDGDLMSTYCLSYLNMGNTKRYWADAYHSIHITMLQCFESIMPNSTFEFYIKRWASFLGVHIDD